MRDARNEWSRACACTRVGVPGVDKKEVATPKGEQTALQKTPSTETNVVLSLGGLGRLP